MRDRDGRSLCPSSKNLRMASAIGSIGLIAAVGITLPATAWARNGESYEAGWATGAGWARETLRVAGTYGISDAEVVYTCPGLANSAASSLTYYYQGGKISGGKIVHADFVKGCVDGAHDTIGE